MLCARFATPLCLAGCCRMLFETHCSQYNSFRHHFSRARAHTHTRIHINPRIKTQFEIMAKIITWISSSSASYKCMFAHWLTERLWSSLISKVHLQCTHTHTAHGIQFPLELICISPSFVFGKKASGSLFTIDLSTYTLTLALSNGNGKSHCFPQNQLYNKFRVGKPTWARERERERVVCAIQESIYLFVYLFGKFPESDFADALKKYKIWWWAGIKTISQRFAYH